MVSSTILLYSYTRSGKAILSLKSRELGQVGGSVTPPLLGVGIGPTPPPRSPSPTSLPSSRHDPRGGSINVGMGLGFCCDYPTTDCFLSSRHSPQSALREKVAKSSPTDLQILTNKLAAVRLHHHNFPIFFNILTLRHFRHFEISTFLVNLFFGKRWAGSRECLQFHGDESFLDPLLLLGPRKPCFPKSPHRLQLICS